MTPRTTPARRLVRGSISVVLAVLALPLSAQQRVTLPSSDTRLAGAAKQVLAIGSEEGASWQMLSNVQQVAFDAQGNLYILDAGNFRVTVVDPRGRLVRTIGKKGGGPGELMSPSGLAIAKDGSVVVADLGRSAFSIFTPEGTFRFNVPFPEDLALPGIGSANGSPGVLANPSGGVFVLGSLNLRMGGGDGGRIAPPAPPTSSPIYTMQLVEKNPPTKVVYHVPRPLPKVTQSGTSTERVTRMIAKEFTPASLWAVLPNGQVAVQHGADYSIRVLDPAGRTLRILTRPFKPRAPSRGDMQAARDLREERMRTGTGGGISVSIDNGQRTIGPARPATEERIKETLATMEFEEVMPVTQRIAATPRGRIWVQRTAPVWGGTGPIDVLDPAGRYIGTLPPQAFPSAFSADGRAAYIERTDDDVEQVVIRQLPAAWL